MQYILNQEEYEDFIRLKGVGAEFERTREILEQLRKRILKEAKFVCYQDLPEEERRAVLVADGYCGDVCPLSPFHKANQKFSEKYSFCDRPKRFSK